MQSQRRCTLHPKSKGRSVNIVLIIIDAGTPQRGGSSGSRFCTDGRRIHDAAHDGGFEAAFTRPGRAKVGRGPAVGEAAFGHEHNVGA